jgi:hypothetical protein
MFARVFFLLAVAVSLHACKKTSTPTAADAICKSDDDCVISCESRGSCCHNPYCEAVQHRTLAADAVAFNGDKCKAEDFARCPTIGPRAKVDHTITPRCRAGACTGERVPITDAAP